MAKAKTGSFYLTETVSLAAADPSGTRNSGTIDLSAYVNVPTGQAIAIDEVDFIWQVGSDFSSDGAQMIAAAGAGALTSQLTDLNPGGVFVRADDQSLVASGALNIDQATSQVSHSADMYPDNFGPSGLSDMFIVVNDQLYYTVGNDAVAVGGQTLYGTVRIRARVVKLSTKDWMAVAIQSTASDN
jgi:hypothetical protein